MCDDEVCLDQCALGQNEYTLLLKLFHKRQSRVDEGGVRVCIEATSINRRVSILSLSRSGCGLPRLLLLALRGLLLLLLLLLVVVM